jgi:N-acylneuraminate cytidylyltransferase
MRIIAIIPARGGSKGIPRKNIQDVNGDALVVRKILQAHESICEEVWVTTEDREIAKISTKHGAKIINRPKYLSSDESSTKDTILHALEFLDCEDSDIFVLLQVTSPLLKVININLCIEKLVNNNNFNSVITIKDGHPFMWETTDEVFWNPSGHSRSNRLRRQDLNTGGWETGGCYAIRVHALRNQKIIYPEPTGTVSVDILESIDIDTFQDLELVRKILTNSLL